MSIYYNVQQKSSIRVQTPRHMGHSENLTCGKLHLGLSSEDAICESEAIDSLTQLLSCGPVDGVKDGDQLPHSRTQTPRNISDGGLYSSPSSGTARDGGIEDGDAELHVINIPNDTSSGCLRATWTWLYVTSG